MRSAYYRLSRSRRVRCHYAQRLCRDIVAGRRATPILDRLDEHEKRCNSLWQTYGYAGTPTHLYWSPAVLEGCAPLCQPR